VEEPVVSEEFDQPFWDDLYGSRPALWSGDPNHHLVAEVEGLAPGAALDVGAGEGGDAIWLARRGWRVTAVDISTVALERAANHAAQAGADVADRIEWLHHDVTEWEPLQGRYDLVSAHFFHLPPAPRLVLLGRMALAVAPGGTLLVVGHQLNEHSHVPDEYFFTGEEVAGHLDPEHWDIVTNAIAERAITDAVAERAGGDRDDHPSTTEDVVVRAARRR
jgi:2-polyprenyl-3-methyl-5-hydroxy-6-metoxy-1,4-benzoquinol methylase